MPARSLPWAGYYADPLHGHCLRAVRPTRDPHVFEIVGVYGDDEPRTGAPWTAELALVAADRALVDFAGKPTRRARYLACRLRGRRIEWADGNAWTRLHAHPAQFAP